MIQMLNIFSERDVASYKQRLDIARTCAGLAVEVCQISVSLLHLTIWLPWHSAYEVLAWEFIRLHGLKGSEAAAAVRAELDGLMDAFSKFASHFAFKSKWPFQKLSRFSIHSAEFLQIS